MRDAIVNPVVEGNFNQPAVPLAPNGTPIADVGDIGGSLGRAANAANEAVDQAVEAAAEMAEQETQKQAGRLIMYAIAGVIGFFVLRNMKVI